MIFYGKELNAYKANCHTHSKVSDGGYTPEEVISIYREKGYDVLFMTDHRKSHDVSLYKEISSPMKVYSGIELHPVGPRRINWHILALGVPHPFPGEFATGKKAVDSVNKAGGLAFVAHPYWCTFTADEVLSLRNTAGIEVYNTSTRYIGKDYNMQLWDEMLEKSPGKTIPALAVDDVHGRCDLFHGWTMILAEENTFESIMEALRNGSFYATQGPEIRKLSLENGIFEAEFSPCNQVTLLTNGSKGYCACAPGKDPADPEKTITTFSFDTSKWAKGNYIRLQIRDEKGNFAWSNPVRL